jgi:hypothetical protein
VNDDELRELAYAEAERRLGRPLTDGERHVDILGGSAALEQGKARLEKAVQRELRRGVQQWVKRRLPPRLRLTGEMYAAIDWLLAQGADAARAEIASMLGGTRQMARAPRKRDRGRARPERDLERELRRIELRIDKEGSSLEGLGDMSRAAVERALEKRVPGARDAASKIVSSAYARGLESVYEEVADLFPGWVISAVMDGNTCKPCRADDGKRYKTLKRALQRMPGFGPNPRCLGGTRCRCRLVPMMPVTS